MKEEVKAPYENTHYTIDCYSIPDSTNIQLKGELYRSQHQRSKWTRERDRAKEREDNVYRFGMYDLHKLGN